MNFQKKYILTTVIFMATPWSLHAQNTGSGNDGRQSGRVQSTERNQGDNLGIEDVGRDSGHWGHQYSDTGFRDNLSFSFGLSALRSNARFSGGGSNELITLSAGPKLGYGAMAAIELGVNDYMGVSLGLNFLIRRFEIAGGDIRWTRNISTVVLPLEARFYLWRVVSLGAGAFSAFSVGNASDTFTSGDSTLVTTGSSRSGIDYGLTASIGAHVPVGRWGFFGEARYNYGLSDSASAGEVEEKMRDLLFTLGMKLKI